MKHYIQSMGNVSPQNTFGQTSLPDEIIEYTANRLRSVEPDYGKLIDVKLIRRMSRIIKMGVAAALECLQKAGVTNPEAIITGTAYGCMEDTGIFLEKLVQNNEQMLTPTAFIQSTHNTIGAQVALLLKCNSYNNTFVHRGLSFESALLDALTLLEEKAVTNALVGAIDEITDFSFAITSRFGLYKQKLNSNLDLFDTHSRGSIAGEGATFFLLSNTPSGNDYGLLDSLHTFYKPVNEREIKEHIEFFLGQQSIAMKDVDLIITGRNGDTSGDKVYDDLEKNLFPDIQTIGYKHLCGEYPTSTGFALWLASSIVKDGKLPNLYQGSTTKAIRRILIYNHFQKIHHSLMLVSAC